MKVAVVAHNGKTFGDGLPALHMALAAAGVKDPDWHDVTSSKQAGKAARKAVKAMPHVLFVWGGDGTVQRCLDAAAGTSTTVAIVPAGTANLLARHLGIPQDVAACVEIGLHGRRRRLDLGKVKGHHFAVMAGVGLDALMMEAAKHDGKARLGRLVYARTGVAAVRMPRFRAEVEVGGEPWYKGPAACILVGNLGSIGGITVFDHARDDDGRLELAVMTAKGAGEWARTMARAVFGKPGLSPFLELTAGRDVRVTLSRKLRYEVDGSPRKAVDRLHFKVRRRAARLCVPKEAPHGAR